MPRTSRFLAALLAVCTCVVADSSPSPDQYCVAGCQTALSLNEFAGSPSALDGYYVEECQNQLHGLDYLSESCLADGGVSILDFDIVSNLTNSDIQQLPQISFGDVSMINTTSVPDQNLYDLGQRTIQVWYAQRATNLLHSEAMFIFWGCIVGLGIVANLLASIPRASKALRPLWTKTSAKLILPPTFTYHCDAPVGEIGTLPPRIESIFIFMYIAINVVLCAVRYELFADNLYYTSTTDQQWRYLADRLGTLALTQLPIIWLFGIRNNILIWATGWHFSTFNHFHRWAARVAALEATLHAISYTVMTFRDGGFATYSKYFQEQYWQCGVMAVVSMTFLIGLSVRLLRVKFYDFFLVAHIVLAAIALVGLFYHTAIFDGQFEGYLWPCVAFWAFDRLMRYARVALNFVSARSAKAAVEFDADTNLLRIDVTDTLGKFSKMSWGSYCFVYSPDTLKFWESHPFTLVRWKSGVESRQTSIRSGSEGKKPETDVRSVNADVETEDRYTLMIRPQKGFTARIAKKALADTEPSLRHLLVEGPYGRPIRFNQNLSDVIFIVGGSGISVAVASIYHLAERSPMPNIKLVWAMRDAPMLASVMDRELRQAASSISVDAYVTTEPAGEEAKLATTQLSCPPRTRVKAGRPDVRQEIEEAARQASRALGIVACGPPAMMNDVRLAAVEQLSRGKTEVHVWLENFAW